MFDPRSSVSLVEFVELIPCGQLPPYGIGFRTNAQVERAPLEYIDWWDSRRLCTETDDISPAGKELTCCAKAG